MSVSALKVITNGKIRPELLAQVNEEVEVVEKELAKMVRSKSALVETVSTHTLLAGGKRLRPAFLSLAAKATGLPFEKSRATRLGACMEMIHMATLIHDDVIDNSATRRGRSTASAEYGNTAAILSGDVLLAKAMGGIIADQDLDIISNVSISVMEVAEGEAMELESRGDFDLEETRHLEILRMKTAALIECCCEIGAMVAMAPHDTKQALKRYGHNVGIAFQIQDDLLDYRGDKAETGKPIAIDFKDGQATLPLIYLRTELSEAELQIARRKFGGAVNEDEIRMIVDWMNTRGAFAKCEAKARHFVDRALEALKPLAPSPAKELLETVAEYVLQRKL